MLPAANLCPWLVGTRMVWVAAQAGTEQTPPSKVSPGRNQGVVQLWQSHTEIQRKTAPGLCTGNCICYLIFYNLILLFFLCLTSVPVSWVVTLHYQGVTLPVHDPCFASRPRALAAVSLCKALCYIRKAARTRGWSDTSLWQSAATHGGCSLLCTSPSAPMSCWKLLTQTAQPNSPHPLHGNVINFLTAAVSV